LPGLTRQSIRLKGIAFEMDARVKPAHDAPDFCFSGVHSDYFPELLDNQFS